MNKNDIKYFLYALLDPRTNTPFYIGITSNVKIRFNRHCIVNLRAFKDNASKAKLIKELKKQNLKPHLQILFEDLNEAKAKSLEIKIIAEARKIYGEKITNISDGGFVVSLSTRKKLSNIRKGRKASDRSKLKISKAKKGIKRTEEAIKKSAIGHLGIRPSENHKRKISEAQLGKDVFEKLSSKNYLYYNYIILDKSIQQISSELKVCFFTISKYLKKHNIEHPVKQNADKLSSKDYLYYNYIILNKSIKKIALELNVGETTVFKCLEKHNISKANEKSYEKLKSYDFLYNEYVVMNKTTSQIAKELNVNRQTVANYLKRNNIQIKNNKKIKTNGE